MNNIKSIFIICPQTVQNKCGIVLVMLQQQLTCMCTCVTVYYVLVTD